MICFVNEFIRERSFDWLIHSFLHYLEMRVFGIEIQNGFLVKNFAKYAKEFGLNLKYQGFCC